jgi:hypothetical protein
MVMLKVPVRDQRFQDDREDSLAAGVIKVIAPL